MGGGGAERAPPMLLHCRSLEVRRPGAAPVHVAAPLPPVWAALFEQQGWKVPSDTHRRAARGPRLQHPSLKRLAGEG